MIILKRYWREITIVILFFVCWFSIRSCRTQKELVKIEQSKSDSSYHAAIGVQLENGQLAYRVKTLEVTSQELKGQDVLSYLKIKDLTDQVGNLNRVVTYYQGKVSANQVFISKGKDSTVYDIRPKYIDLLNDSSKKQHSHTEKVFDWGNKWLRLHEVYNPVTDSLKRHYVYNAEFQFTSYRRGANLFRRGDLVSEIIFSDPWLVVGDSQSLIVKEGPPKRFYFGPTLSYDPFSGRVVVGIGVVWGVIRF